MDRLADTIREEAANVTLQESTDVATVETTARSIDDDKQVNRTGIEEEKPEKEKEAAFTLLSFFLLFLCC